MRAVFRWKELILILALLTIQFYALAIGCGEYGQAVISDYMEWTTIDTTYSYSLNCVDSSGQGVSTSPFSISTDTAKSGNQSMKLNTGAMGTGWSAKIIRNVSGTSVYGDAFCFEAYVKGYSSKPAGLSLSINFTDSYGMINFNTAPYNVVCNYDDADSSGWHRIWATIPYLQSKNNGNVCIQYVKSAGDGFSALYFDDIMLRPLPVTMVINDVACNPGSSVSLNSIRVKGYDIFNNEKEVVNTSLIHWSVLSGSASIDGSNNLTYGGTSSGDVVLNAELYGITTQTTVRFVAGVNASAVSSVGKCFKANIINSSDNAVNASIIATLYDGERLYNVYNTSKSYSSGETSDILTPAVNIPKWVKDPVIKVYVWDALFGMRAYKDVSANFYNFSDDFSYGLLAAVSGGGQALGQNWQTSPFVNGHGYMSTTVSADPDNTQNQALNIQGGWNDLSGVNLVVPHSGLGTAKVIQVDIRGVWTSPTQQYGLCVMTKAGTDELQNHYQLSCTAGTCKFAKMTNYTIPAADTQSSSNTMDMNKWYTFKLILNGSQVSWSIIQKGGGYSWSGSYTDSAPIDASSVQLYVAGQDNPPAYFDNFILRSYDPSID